MLNWLQGLDSAVIGSVCTFLGLFSGKWFWYRDRNKQRDADRVQAEDLRDANLMAWVQHKLDECEDQHRVTAAENRRIYAELAVMNLRMAEVTHAVKESGVEVPTTTLPPAVEN